MYKLIKKNKGKIIITLIVILVSVVVLKTKKENFKTLSSIKKKIGKMYTGRPASRDPDSRILKIERSHKCNQAGCATRETKQKKHILL